MRDIREDAKAYAAGKSLTDIQKDAQKILALVKAGQIVEKDMIAFAKLYGITVTPAQATSAVKMAKATDFKTMSESQLKDIVTKCASDKRVMDAVNAIAKAGEKPAPKPAPAAPVKPAEKKTVPPVAPKEAPKPAPKSSVEVKQAPAAKPAAAKPAPAAPAKGEYYCVTSSSLYVRSGAGMSNPDIGAMHQGTLVFVSEIKDEWGKIDYNGKQGWISLKYAKKVAAPTPVGKYIVTASSLNVRKTPDTTKDPIGSIKNSSFIEVKEVKNKWGKISFEGKEAWISLDYAKPTTATKIDK